MTRATTEQFAADPLASVSGRFALKGTTFTDRSDDGPSPAGARPWGLRRARSARSVRMLPDWRYDQRQQKAVDSAGHPLVELPVGGQPTADTTATVDGEDPPSSEDWDND